MDKLLSSTIGRKEFESLLRKVEQGDRIYSAVDLHIKNVKAQVERETEKTMQELQRRLVANKMAVFGQLDNFQRLFIQNLDTYRALVEPLVSFNRQYKYYSNPNNFSIKLYSEISRKSIDWYNDLKRVMTLTTKIIDRPQHVYENMLKSTQFMAANSEELPHVRHPDQEGRSGAMLQAAVEEIFKDIVMIKEPKLLSHYLGDSQ